MTRPLACFLGMHRPVWMNVGTPRRPVRRCVRCRIIIGRDQTS